MSDIQEPDRAAIEAGRRLFAGRCDFVIGVAGYDQIPPVEVPEVAFAGRSNVGKSSLVNALTGRRTLARTSNTPGRTRQLNFFDLAGVLMLVDLPGYGYARVAKTEVAEWTQLVRDYLRGRENLRRVCLLIDARRGTMNTDEEVMTLLDQAAVPYRLVLTKADKLGPAKVAAVEAAVRAAAKRHPAAMPDPLVTSASKGVGIAELRAELAALAASP